MVGYYINAMQLQRRTKERDTLDLLDFIARASESLIQLDKPIFQTIRRRGRPVAYAVPNSDDSDSNDRSTSQGHSQDFVIGGGKT